MSHRLLDALRRQLLTDLGPSSVMEALPPAIDLKAKQDRLPKSTHPPSGEDMDARLRSIRRYITPKELAALLHWDIETVYRKIKADMPPSAAGPVPAPATPGLEVGVRSARDKEAKPR